LHGTPKNKLVRVFLPLRAFTNTRNLSPTRALLKKQAAETLAKPLPVFVPLWTILRYADAPLRNVCIAAWTARG